MVRAQCFMIWDHKVALFGDIQHGFQPGLIASDEATKAMPDKGELQSTAIFGPPSCRGLVEKITGRSASLFKLRFWAKEHRTCLCESCSINIGCEKKKLIVTQVLMVQLVDSSRKNILRALGYDNIDLKTKLIFVVWYRRTFAPSCWSFRERQGPKREPRPSFTCYKAPIVCRYSPCNQT